MIKLIATDIDGTLLDETRNIAAQTAAAFKKYSLPKLLISARMPDAMYYLQRDLDIMHEPIVCYNGALIMNQHQVLYSIVISYEAIVTLNDIAQHTGLHLSIYRHNDWFVTKKDRWTDREINNTRVQPTVQPISQTLGFIKKQQDDCGAHKVMFMGDEDRMNSAFAKAEKALANTVHLYRSKNTYTEISPLNISKKSALELVLQECYKDIKMEDVAAFGDNYNDIEMIEAAGYGVAVGNAREELKAVASHTTAHHKEHGVAQWLERQLMTLKNA